MLKIETIEPPPRFALFQLGFRPFFAAAGLYAAAAMTLWLLDYGLHWSLHPAAMPSTYWHGHEMLYGYGMAVVAGFLLTAVGNWTGIATLKNVPLGLALGCWLLARVTFHLPGTGLWVAAIADLAFLGIVLIGVSRPVWQVRQWKQIGILSKFFLLMVCSLLFYAGALGYLDDGMSWGLYGGIYLLLSLVLVMARRVLPFFIERGVDEDFSAKSRAWIDTGSLVLVLVWAVLEVFSAQLELIAWLSLALFILHAIRLYDWHTPGIWRKPLLWALYLGYASLVLGFGLRALSIWGPVSPFVALHAFVYGGVGLMTLGMMARVTLGHTGRNVFDPPRALGGLFGLLGLGAVLRVLLPIADPANYATWIFLSQLVWILAFIWFSALFVPFLARPRVDGRPG